MVRDPGRTAGGNQTGEAESQARDNVGRIYKARDIFELGHDTIRALISEASPGKVEDGF